MQTRGADDIHGRAGFVQLGQVGSRRFGRRQDLVGGDIDAESRQSLGIHGSRLGRVVRRQDKADVTGPHGVEKGDEAGHGCVPAP